MGNGFLTKIIINNTPDQSILVYFAIYLYFLNKIILFEEIYDHDQICLCKNVVFVNINLVVEQYFYYTTAKILKSGKILVASLLLTDRPIVTCGSRVSRAPPHYTLPTFLNLHSSLRFYR